MGRPLATGAKRPLSQALMPISLWVRAEPSMVAAPVMTMDAHRTPLVMTSLKSMMGLPS